MMNWRFGVVTLLSSLVIRDAALKHHLRVRWRCGTWRYWDLMALDAGYPKSQRRTLLWGLRRCARRARTSDLEYLLDGDGGWRDHIVVGWLIAVGRRTEMRPRIARDLADPERKVGPLSYDVALARFGTEEDAQILRDHLVMSFGLYSGCDDDFREDSLATLRYLDRKLGTAYAVPLLADDGPWRRQCPDASDARLEEMQQHMESLIAFAEGRWRGSRPS